MTGAPFRAVATLREGALREDVDGAGLGARPAVGGSVLRVADDWAAVPPEPLPARALPVGPVLRGVLWAAVLGLSAVPFLLVLAISFGEKIEGAAWEWGFGLEHYARFLVGIGWPEEVSFLYAQKLWYALWYALVAAVLAMALAFPFAWTMTRQSRRAQAAWLAMLLAVLSLSEVFVVMGWDILLSNRSGLPMVLRETGVTAALQEAGWFPLLREWGLATPRDVRFKPSEVATVLTMTYLVWPYAVILLYPPLSRLDRSLTEAARTMGAGPWTVMRTVVIPSVRLPLIGATLLLFVFLLGVFVAVSVFAEPARQTLAISIFEAIRGAELNAPFGAAQAVVLLVVAGAFLAASAGLTRLGGRR